MEFSCHRNFYGKRIPLNLSTRWKALYIMEYTYLCTVRTVHTRYEHNLGMESLYVYVHTSVSRLCNSGGIHWEIPFQVLFKLFKTFEST